MTSAAVACAVSALRCSSFGESPVGPAVPVADGGEDAAPAACGIGTDLANDPRHCGRCGHDCGKGTCASGACRSYVLADQQPKPWYVAVDDASGNVYWSSFVSPEAQLAGGDGSVRGVAKSGGPVMILAPAGSDSFDVIADGQDVVFSTGTGNVMAVPRAGGAVRTFWEGSGSDFARRGSSLFFTGRADGDAGVLEVSAGGIKRRASFPEARSAEGVAVDDRYIFWANHTGVDGGLKGGSIGKVERDGKSPQPNFQPDQEGARRLAVDGTYVYWTSDTQNTVRRKLASGGPPEIFFTGQVRYGTIVIDDTDVYITVELENRLVRIPRAGGAPVNVETGLDQPVGLAQDATSLYFTERGGGRVRRLVK